MKKQIQKHCDFAMAQLVSGGIRIPTCLPGFRTSVLSARLFSPHYVFHFLCVSFSTKQSTIYIGISC